MTLPKADRIGGLCACRAVTTTRVARVALCGSCASSVIELARASLVVRRGGVGLGRQCGPLRPDWGSTWAHLECDVCGASWVGQIDEPCAYCAHRIERTLVEQRLLLLWPDLPDVGDKRRTEALKAWGSRLRVGHEAGTITSSELDAAWKRETTK